MKILELKLKKDVLIVDLENESAGFINGDYEFLCDGSELTEEIASEFMSDFDAFNEFALKYEYLKNFIYIVESKGFYWLENPINEPNKYVQRCMSFENLSNQFKLFDEKEEKTFRNPLIFVKK